MLPIIFIILISAGLLFSLCNVKYQRTAGILQLLLVLVLAWLAYRGYSFIEEYKISWIKLPKMKLALNLSSTPILWEILIIPFTSVCLTIYNNYFLPSNKNSVIDNGIMFFVLSGFVLLLSAANFMQFIMAVEIISLGAFALAKNAEKSSYYVGVTVLSDIALLAGFALLYGQFDSMKLQNIMYFSQNIRHQALISGLFLFAFLAKSGLFMFNSELLALQDLSINRFFNIILTTTPMVSLIIFIKTFPIIKLFPYFDIFFNILLFIGLVLGGVLFIAKDSLKSKGIYLYMMFSSIIFMALKQDISRAGQIIIGFYTPLYVFFTLFQCIAISSSNEVRVSQMGGFIEKLPLSFSLFLMNIVITIGYSLHFANIISPIFTYIWIAFLFISMACLQHDIYFPPSRADERVMALLKNPPIWYTFSLFCIVIGYLYFLNQFSQAVAIAFIIYCLCIIFASKRYVPNISENNVNSNNNILINIYQIIFTAPLKVIGRVLWIMIDFIFIERTIFASLQKIYKFLLHISGLMGSASIFVYIGLILVGVVIGMYIIGGNL